MPLAMGKYGRAAPKCNVLLHMLAVNSSEKRPERATFLRQAYRELAVALAKSNAMCGWWSMHLVMEEASGRAQLGAVPRGLRE
jgi:FtsH-binding integral membrane protein